MSERNGDKARFGRERRRKILRRQRIRELRNQLSKGVELDPSLKTGKHPIHPNGE